MTTTKRWKFHVLRRPERPGKAVVDIKTAITGDLIG